MFITDHLDPQLRPTLDATEHLPGAELVSPVLMFLVDAVSGLSSIVAR